MDIANTRESKQEEEDNITSKKAWRRSSVETALVLILPVVSTHSRLPFKDEASDQYEKTDTVTRHPKVSGDIFSIILWQQ